MSVFFSETVEEARDIDPVAADILRSWAYRHSVQAGIG
jgi:hypothetical protein